MDNSPGQTKDRSSCEIFVYIRLCYIFLNHLFKINVHRSINMSFGNKFFNKERGRVEIMRIMDYYINANNIAKIDNIKENKEEVKENNHQVGDDKTRKK